jgi:hypothetical protein
MRYILVGGESKIESEKETVHRHLVPNMVSVSHISPRSGGSMRICAIARRQAESPSLSANLCKRGKSPGERRFGGWIGVRRIDSG